MIATTVTRPFGIGHAVPPTRSNREENERKIGVEKSDGFSGYTMEWNRSWRSGRLASLGHDPLLEVSPT